MNNGSAREFPANSGNIYETSANNTLTKYPRNGDLADNARRRGTLRPKSPALVQFADMERVANSPVQENDKANKSSKILIMIISP